jgi:hypothetical protein
MQPQIIIQDFGGVHNADQEGTRARLVRGGSYKRQRIVVVIPAIAPIPPKVYLSHCNLVFPPNNGVVRMMAEGMEVGDAYSSCVDNVLAHPDLSQWEYMLHMESDNAPPGDGVVRLVEDLEEHPELSAVGGLYFTKGPGGVAQIWGDPSDPVLNFRPQVPQLETLQECCGLGQGFTLFRLSMFHDKRIERPFFKTLNGMNGQGVGTQDLQFWGKARRLGYRCAVDTRVKVGHYDYEGKFGPCDMMW